MKQHLLNIGYQLLDKTVQRINYKNRKEFEEVGTITLWRKELVTAIYETTDQYIVCCEATDVLTYQLIDKTEFKKAIYEEINAL